MKKIICALLGSLFCGATFAGVDVGGTIGGSASDEFFVARAELLAAIQESEKNFKPEEINAMMAKYDEVAETTTVTGYDSMGGKFEFREGQRPLVFEDLAAICTAGGLKSKDFCYRYLVNPLYTYLGRYYFKNVCVDKTGVNPSNAHCVDDVFTKKYDVVKVTKNIVHDIRKTETIKSTKSYAQNVNIPLWPAYGFAIEYAKMHGHSVRCSAEVNDNFINCTSVGNGTTNQHFYTFKFAGTNNQTDANIEMNLIKGLCALYGAEYNTPRLDFGIGNGYFYDNTTANYGCSIECDKILSVANKFGLTPLKYKESEYGYCPFSTMFNVDQQDLLLYPGYEYMSTVFTKVQTVLEPSLVDFLRKYVKAQGISVESFKCDYAPTDWIKWNGKNTFEDALANATQDHDDVLRCYINDTPVDFIFDDLFEAKDMEQKIGRSSKICLLQKVDIGKTAEFDGKHCVGISEEQCVGVNRNCDANSLCGKIPGGAYWDPKTLSCVMADAEMAVETKRLARVLGETVVVIGITAATGGTATLMFTESALVLGTEAAMLTLEDYKTKINPGVVRDVIEGIEKCNINPNQTPDQCTKEQIDCVTKVGAKVYALLMLDPDDVQDLSDYHFQVLNDAVAYIEPCWTEEMAHQALLGSAQEASFIKGKNQWVSAGFVLVSIGTMFIPSGNLTRIGKLKNLNKNFLQKAKKYGVKKVEKVRIGNSAKKVRRYPTADLNDAERAAFLKKVKNSGVQYADFKQIQEFADKDALMAALSSKGREAYKVLPEDVQNEILASINSSIKAQKDCIVVSTRLDGKLDEILIDINYTGKGMDANVSLTPTIEGTTQAKRSWKNRSFTAIGTFVGLTAAEEVVTIVWDLVEKPAKTESSSGSSSGSVFIPRPEPIKP